MSQLDALVIGERTFPFHSFDEMGPHVEAALGDGVDATLTEDRDDLLDLSGYDLVVDYLTDSTLTDDSRRVSSRSSRTAAVISVCTAPPTSPAPTTAREGSTRGTSPSPSCTTSSAATSSLTPSSPPST